VYRNVLISCCHQCRICVIDNLRLIIFLNVIAPRPVMCSFMLICHCCFAIVKVLLKKVTYLECGSISSLWSHRITLTDDTGNTVLTTCPMLLHKTLRVVCSSDHYTSKFVKAAEKWTLLNVKTVKSIGGFTLTGVGAMPFSLIVG